MAITAVYPGTFDPITNGHADLIRRSSALFDHIVIGVAENINKGTFFSLGERLNFVRDEVASYPNVDVQSFDGLLVRFAQKNNAHIILRGLRAVTDFDYELQLAGMNRRLDAKLESVFLTPEEKYSFISSSLVREIAGLGGDVSAFVSPAVGKAIRQRCQENRQKSL